MSRSLTALKRVLVALLCTATTMVPAGLSAQGGPANRSTDGQQPHACRKCTLTSLKGCYGYSYTGTVEGFGGIAAVGPINFDGEGNTSATYSVNLGGTNFQGSFTGTYTVGEDCTGTITIDLPLLGTSSNGRFVIVESGRQAFFMGTDPGATVTGVATRR